MRESYRNPVYTYDVNVMGTVHILECVRESESVRSFLNVTTDKVYRNREWEWGYRENEELNGFDPYSNSKSCSELITCAYRNSFFQKGMGSLRFPLPEPEMSSAEGILRRIALSLTATERRRAMRQ